MNCLASIWANYCVTIFVNNIFDIAFNSSKKPNLFKKITKLLFVYRYYLGFLIQFQHPVLSRALV